MGYASLSGRAKTSPSNPRAHAICDRCGFRYNHYTLRWQMDWAGASLINKRLLVCDRCYDEPQQQLRAIIIPADPVPIINPRPEAFVDAETDYRVTSGQYLVPVSVSGDGTTATFTFSISSSITPPAVGSGVIVRGMVPQNYNGTYVVTASSSTPVWTISIANGSVAPLVEIGQVIINIDLSTGLPYASI